MGVVGIGIKSPKAKLDVNGSFGATSAIIAGTLTEVEILKVINLLGATIYETQHLFSNAIQLPTYAQGVHFVMLFLKDGAVLTQKMMIQR